MRLIIQRVRHGSVTVSDKMVGKIGPGLLVLLGFHKDDDQSKFDQAVNRLVHLRLWDSQKGAIDSAKKTKAWDSNVMENDYEILLVSQFTLYAVLNGNKPDFHLSKKADEALLLFDEFVGRVRKAYKPDKVQIGAFGEYMDVQLANDGPVTINLDY